MIIAVDYATSMGYAYTYEINGDNTVYVGSIVGNHFEHLSHLKKIKGKRKATVIFEQLNFFRNAKTVRTLLLKTGYVAFSLSKTPEFINTNAPRKFLGCKGKSEVFELFKPYGIKNNDESDALALLLHKMGKREYEVKIVHD